MKTRLSGINRKLLSFSFLLGLCGCGAPPSQTAQTSQSQSTAATEGKSDAEVSQTFRGFDEAVDKQTTPLSDPAPASEKSDTASATTSSPAAAVPGNRPTQPQPANKSSATANTAPPKPTIPAPNEEQLKRWSTPSFERLQLLACRDSGEVGLLTSAAIVGDSDMYALAGTRVTAWMLSKEEPLGDFANVEEGKVVKSFAASPDGKWLAAGDGKGNLQIWDLPDFQQRVSKKIYPSGVAHLSISPDSKSIATSSFTGEVTIWDAAELTLKKKFTVANQALQGMLYIAPNQIAVAAQGSSIWDTESGKQEHTLTSEGYYSTFAISPDGKRLAYGTEGKIEFWNVLEGKVDGSLNGSFSRNDLAAFSPDGKYLATADKFTIQVWDLSAVQLVQVIDAIGWESVALKWFAKSSLLMIASQNGRVRFWGNAATASALGWKPLHAPVSLPGKDSGEPATPVQLTQISDLRTFPKLPGAKVMVANETMLNYMSPTKIDEAKTFYHYFLTRDGWSIVEEPTAPPDMLNFNKQGFGVSVYLSKNADESTQVNISASGNIDLRKLPKYDAVPPVVVYEAENTVTYRVNANLLDIETSLIKKFFDAGWTSYARLNTSKNETADSRTLQMIRGATTLLVSIQRQPADPNSYHVSYAKFLTTRSLPIPKDAGFIEFDGSTQPLMVASTAMTLEQTRDFYDKEMALQGWLRRDSGKLFKEKFGWMDFIRGQCDVTLVLVGLDSGRTQIQVGEDLEHASWQLQKTKEQDPKVASNGIEAADIPALNGWSIVKYDAEQKQIDVVAKGATTFAVAEAYGKMFETLGWKTDGSGVKSDDYLLAEFTKSKAEVTLRATLRGGEIQASLSGDGLLWTKPLPVAKQIIAYETWLRIHRHPASLELMDQYMAEMKAIAKE